MLSLVESTTSLTGIASEFPSLADVFAGTGVSSVATGVEQPEDGFDAGGDLICSTFDTLRIICLPQYLST
jgi:hypothetical protein